MDREQSRKYGRIGAHVSWANTVDRTARTAPARAALEARFLAEAGGDQVRAEHIRKAFYARLAVASAAARRTRSAAGAATIGEFVYAIYVPGAKSALAFVDECESDPRRAILRKKGLELVYIDDTGNECPHDPDTCRTIRELAEAKGYGMAPNGSRRP